MRLRLDLWGIPRLPSGQHRIASRHENLVPAPRYLDQKRLVACWRETLLTQKVLNGGSAGYRIHPQLLCFRAHEDPLLAVGVYLRGLYPEAVARGYNLNESMILAAENSASAIDVTSGRMADELAHLRARLAQRDPVRIADLADPHPLFRVVDGDTAK